LDHRLPEISGSVPSLLTDFSKLVKLDLPTSEVTDHEFSGKHNGSDQAIFLKTICPGGLLTLISGAQWKPLEGAPSLAQ
jgi:hypothetical protein